MQWKENTSKSKVSPYWVLWCPREQSPQEERGAWKNCWEMWFDQVGLEGCKGYHQYIGMGKKKVLQVMGTAWSKVSISLGCHMVEFTGISPGCLGFWIPNWARPFQLLTREMLPRHLDSVSVHFSQDWKVTDPGIPPLVLSVLGYTFSPWDFLLTRRKPTLVGLAI